ncbi:down syndrome cell adhesion molecule-like protein Dscam2, partial [Nephila pilipes]
YTLHYKTDDGNWQHERLSSDADKYTLRNLRCGTRYQLYMTASNSLGTGEPSEAVSARTKGAENAFSEERKLTVSSPTVSFLPLKLPQFCKLSVMAA